MGEVKERTPEQSAGEYGGSVHGGDLRVCSGIYEQSVFAFAGLDIYLLAGFEWLLLTRSLHAKAA